MGEGTGVPICRAAEHLGVHARDGRFAGIVARDLGQGGRVVALWKWWSWQAGPTGQRAERAQRGRSRWRAGPGHQGERRRWLAGLLARSERLQRAEQRWASAGRCSGRGGAAQEERGAGCSGEEGEKGWAEGKSWAGHSVGLGFVFLSYFLSPFLF